jgi:hypothetical protein
VVCSSWVEVWKTVGIDQESNQTGSNVYARRILVDLEACNLCVLR